MSALASSWHKVALACLAQEPPQTLHLIMKVRSVMFTPQVAQLWEVALSLDFTMLILTSIFMPLTNFK